MQLVAAVRHIHYVCQWLLGEGRSTFCQQVRLLMLVAEEPALRAIGLTEHQVSHRLETRALPCVEESIDLRPAVEHDRYAVLLQNPVCFPHRGPEPIGVRIVLNGASVTVAVV